MEKLHSIKILPKDVVDKISAGEVINRPASVLKELLENSIDAEANKIDVYVEAGGKRLIEVVDNGVGIKPDEITLAVKRHATSKIEDIDDLYNLNSYGFRGEALYSISAVSKFSIISKPEDYPLGKELYVEGGNIMSLSDTGCPTGTKVKVKDLFFNVPARQKFLKNSRVEFTHILDIFLKYALNYPNIHFRLFKDGKLYLNLEPSDLESRLEDIYPKLKGKFLKVEAENEIGRIEGFIALDESYKKQGFLYVNKRPIKNRDLKKVISSYAGNIFFLLFIDVYPYLVDFNIHPTKEEVKFRKDKPVYDLIKKALKNEDKKSYTISKNPISQALAQPVVEYGKETKRDNFKLLGQVEDTFLVVYLDGDIYIVDQHVAHERINYELLYRKYLKEDIPTKELNRKINIELSPIDLEKFKLKSDDLKRLGFDFKLENNLLKIFKIPIYLDRNEAKSILMEVIHSEDSFIPLDKILGEIACSKSLKSGEFIDENEALALLKTWLETNNPNLCPHGRPIYYKVSLDDVRKILGRN